MLVKFRSGASSQVTPRAVRFSLLPCRLVISVSWLFLSSQNVLQQIWSDFTVNVEWLHGGLMFLWLLWV